MSAIDYDSLKASIEAENVRIRATLRPASYLPPPPEPQLLDVCLALHGHNTGASDPLPAATLQSYVFFLARRLHNWKPSTAESKPFDDAVKAVAEAAWRETMKVES